MEVLQKQLGWNFVSQAFFLRPLVSEQRGYVLHAQTTARAGPDAPKQGDIVVAGSALRMPGDDLTQKPQFRVPFLAPAPEPLLVTRCAERLRMPLGRLLASARRDRRGALMGEIIKLADLNRADVLPRHQRRTVK